jgi:hypothetical protein
VARFQLPASWCVAVVAVAFGVDVVYIDAALARGARGCLGLLVTLLAPFE